jgi:hypothetical protein
MITNLLRFKSIEPHKYTVYAAEFTHERKIHRIKLLEYPRRVVIVPADTETDAMDFIEFLISLGLEYHGGEEDPIEIKGFMFILSYANKIPDKKIYVDVDSVATGFEYLGKSWLTLTGDIDYFLKNIGVEQNLVEQV